MIDPFSSNANQLTDVRGVFSDVRPAEAHAQAHISRLEGRGVVCAVSRGPHHLSAVRPAGGPLQQQNRTKQNRSPNVHETIFFSAFVATYCLLSPP